MRRSSTINKARLEEDIKLIRSAVTCLATEVSTLNPGDNLRQKMRLQSILGASIIVDLREATEKVESAFRGVRSIKKEI